LTLRNLSGDGGHELQMLGGGLYLTSEIEHAEMYGEYIYELELDIPEEDILKLSFEDYDTYGGIFNSLAYEAKIEYDHISLMEEECGATPHVYFVPTPPFVTTVKGTTYVVADCDLSVIIRDLKNIIARESYGEPSFSSITHQDIIEEIEGFLAPLTALLGHERIDSTDLGAVAARHGYKVLWVDNTILPRDEVLVVDESIYNNGLRIKGFSRRSTR
jgi:hypothetical protein